MAGNRGAGRLAANCRSRCLSISSRASAWRDDTPGAAEVRHAQRRPKSSGSVSFSASDSGFSASRCDRFAPTTIGAYCAQESGAGAKEGRRRNTHKRGHLGSRIDQLFRKQGAEAGIADRPLRQVSGLHQCRRAVVIAFLGAHRTEDRGVAHLPAKPGRCSLIESPGLTFEWRGTGRRCMPRLEIERVELARSAGIQSRMHDRLRWGAFAPPQPGNRTSRKPTRTTHPPQPSASNHDEKSCVTSVNSFWTVSSDAKFESSAR